MTPKAITGSDADVWLPPTGGPVETAAGLLAGAAGRAAAPVARAALGAGLKHLFHGEGEVPVSTTGDAGWFGPDSVVWRVHADSAVFCGGIAALLLQALHPLAMAGVSAHSDFRVDPLGRLRRTASFVGDTSYGTTADATRACATIRRVHSVVKGSAPDGRPFSAEDPELLDWVHTAEFAMFAATHRRFAADPMSPSELDRYAAEVARIGEELGDPSPPRSWGDISATLDRYRPHLAVTEATRDAWHFLASAPVPAPAKPAYHLLFNGAVACLPDWARDLWGAPQPSTAELLACATLVRSLGAVMGDPPRYAAAKARVRG